MEVLTKILQQGTEFDTLAETALADRFERLVELVTMMGDQGELPIAMALANVVPCSQWVGTFVVNFCLFSLPVNKGTGFIDSFYLSLSN